MIDARGSNDPLYADVLIVGAGMVGGVLAWALGHSGLQVAVLERGELSQAGSAAGERSTALSWGSQQLLQAVGLWGALDAQASPIEHIHVSQRGHLGTVRMSAREHALDALGYVVRNSALLQSLGERLPSAPQVRLFERARLTGLAHERDSVKASLDSGQQISAKLLVLADGGGSATRELAGFQTQSVDYSQRAIVATVTTTGAPARTAWERFTPGGPMALLPLGGDRLSLVYTLDEEAVDAVMALDDAGFLARVQADIGQRAGRLIRVSPRQAFPLHKVEAMTSWQGRVLLLGNAARTLHPVAGQGFNLALRDTLMLAEQLQELALGQDPGSDFMREQFLSRRASDQRQTVALTDTLARLFKGRSGLLGHLRGAGLVATDRLPALRHGFARRSMGLAHRTPKVARPLADGRPPK